MKQAMMILAKENYWLSAKSITSKRACSISLNRLT